MIAKDIYGQTVNTDKRFEIQVRIVYVQKTLFGHTVKKSKEWSHWQYYKTMKGLLDALKHYKATNNSTIFNKSKYRWDFRPAHKYYHLILAIILILSLSSCIVPRYADVGYYARKWSWCPEYPNVQHWRAVGKGFNPENCNYIN